MSKKVLIGAISGLIGFAVGGVSGYFLCKKRIEKACDKKFEEYVENYHAKNAPDKVEPEENDEKPVKKEEKSRVDEAYEDFASRYNGKSKEKKERIPKPVGGNEKDYDFDPDAPENRYKIKRNGNKGGVIGEFIDDRKPDENGIVDEKVREHPFPYIIDEDEHYACRPEYDLMCYFWHRDTMTMTDGDGQIIEDVDGEIGLENLERWDGKPIQDCDDLYIRNENTGLDYCVVVET